MKEEAGFAALASLDESYTDSTNIALPIKLEEEGRVQFATPASALKPRQVQHIKKEDEMLPESALLSQRPEARQWRPIKIEDGDLPTPISSHSTPQIR